MEKKEPCLEHEDKNFVKEQCPNFKRPYHLYCFPAEMTKGKEKDEWIQALKGENPNRTKWTSKNGKKLDTLTITSKQNTSKGR